MSELSEKRCTPCEKGTPPLAEKDVEDYAKRLDHEWRIVAGGRLERTFRFKNFRDALGFTNEVGRIAEDEGHHPDIALSWGKVAITLYTHKIGGLSINDFILAAKIDELGRP